MHREKRNPKRKSKNKSYMQMIVAICFMFANAVLGVLCIDGINSEFTKKYFTLISSLYGVFLVLIWGTFAVLYCKGKTIARNFLFLMILFMFFIFIVWIPLQKTGFFEVFKDSKRLQEYLKTTGAWMPVLYVLLQFLQVVILPIPSIVSTIAGVALFGAFWTTIYSFLGIMSGSLFAFFLGRKCGMEVVIWITGADTFNKWKKKVHGKDTLILTVMFFLPFFPDDILCFLAGLSSMKVAYFIFVIGFARLIGIACTCYSVNFIPFTTWWGILLWIVIFFIGVFACIFVNRHTENLQKMLQFRRKRRH